MSQNMIAAGSSFCWLGFLSLLYGPNNRSSVGRFREFRAPRPIPVRTLKSSTVTCMGVPASRDHVCGALSIKSTVLHWAI